MVQHISEKLMLFFVDYVLLSDHTANGFWIYPQVLCSFDLNDKQKVGMVLVGRHCLSHCHNVR